MNIIFLTPEYYALERRSCGGLGVYIRKTAAALCARGHTVCVIWLSDRSVTWKDGNVSIYEVASISSYWQLPIGRFGFLKNIFDFLVDRLRIRRVVRKKLAEGFQIVHAASYLSPALFLPKTWPVVCRLSSLQHLCLGAAGVAISRWNAHLVWAERRQLGQAACVFGPSRFIAAQAEKLTGRAVAVIPTITEPKLVKEQSDFFINQLKGKRYLLYFGQLSRIKGTDTIIEALKDILLKINDIYMVFIGRDDGFPSGLSCKDYAQKCLPYKLYKRVLFFPPLTYAELLPCIKNCICVLQPSRVDNLPNACIESLLCCKPIIATTPTSIEELVYDGINGFLIPIADPSALSSCVCDFLLGRKSLIKLGLLNNDSMQSLSMLEALYRKVQNNCKFINIRG